VNNDEEGLGFGFYAKLVGICLAVGLAAFVILLLIARAAYAWGFLGAFAIFSLILLAIAWIYDRRQARG
jgi:membrane protein implicated in regulation of membrane protease activity